MAFFDDDEHLILMDMQVRYEDPATRLPAEDIKSLSEAGIKTAIMFCTDWNWIFDQYNSRIVFGYYADRIKLLRDNGMKVLMHSCSFFPNWMPDRWCMRAEDGEIFRVPSPWNTEAMDWYRYSLIEIRDRAADAGAILINSYLSDGETLWPNKWAFYDQSAIDDYQGRTGKFPTPCDPDTINWAREKQAWIYSKTQSTLATNQANPAQIWTAMHPALASIPSNGCNNLDYIIERAENELRDIPHENHHLYCTWVQWGGLWPTMAAMAARYGEFMWGGAEYAEGVVNTTRNAIKQGLRGLLINPCHPFTKHERVSPWMTNNIMVAMNEWNGVGRTWNLPK